MSSIWPTREDFGPCEMNEQLQKAFWVWVGGDWKRAEVATVAMANSVRKVESLRSVAARLGLTHPTVSSWSEEWMGLYRQAREFDGPVLLGDIVRMAEKD